jgi:hypothetical protein
VKRAIAAAVGLFGLVAYVRRRRRSAPVEVEPADELRAKLAESRTSPAAATETDPASADEAEVAPDALGERRQDVHDRARSALDELG